jgi:hypothetical protein
VEKPDKIPFPKKPEALPLDMYEDAMELVKKQWMELCEKVSDT